MDPITLFHQIIEINNEKTIDLVYYFNLKTERDKENTLIALLDISIKTNNFESIPVFLYLILANRNEKELLKLNKKLIEVLLILVNENQSEYRDYAISLLFNILFINPFFFQYINDNLKAKFTKGIINLSKNKEISKNLLIGFQHAISCLGYLEDKKEAISLVKEHFLNHSNKDIVEEAKEFIENC